MGDQDFLDRQAFKDLIENRSPVQTAFFCRHASVYNDPTIIIAQKPEIDPFKRKGQWHAHPIDTLCHRLDGTWQWRFATWIGQPIGRIEFHAIHRHCRILIHPVFCGLVVGCRVRFPKG